MHGSIGFFVHFVDLFNYKKFYFYEHNYICNLDFIKGGNCDSCLYQSIGRVKPLPFQEVKKKRTWKPINNKLRLLV